MKHPDTIHFLSPCALDERGNTHSHLTPAQAVRALACMVIGISLHPTNILRAALTFSFSLVVSNYYFYYFASIANSENPSNL